MFSTIQLFIIMTCTILYLVYTLLYANNYAYISTLYDFVLFPG